MSSLQISLILWSRCTISDFFEYNEETQFYFSLVFLCLLQKFSQGVRFKVEIGNGNILFQNKCIFFEFK